MSFVRGAITTIGLLLTFLLQEAGMSKIHLPFSGFSLYLTVVMALITLEMDNAVIITGFIGGVILDLSPSTNSPFGQWALILTGVAYLLTNNRDFLGSFDTRPGSAVLILSASVMTTLTLYVIVSAILGEEIGSFAFVIKTIIANGVWSALIAPFIIPALGKIRSVTMRVQEH